MSWRDRDYNRAGASGMGLFDSPWSILGWSLPLGTWRGIRVRLHFWLILAIIFDLAAALRTGNWIASFSLAVLTILVVLLHEFGHRITAQWVGGRHDDFLLWPAGGLVPPLSPPRPWPTFVTNVGGIAINLLICLGGRELLWWNWHRLPPTPWNPLFVFSGTPFWSFTHGPVFTLLLMMYLLSLSLVLINLLPFYWFDGGPLLQSILWRWTGLYQAINITCIVGMVIAAPMTVFALYEGSILAVVFWALLFFAAWMKRRELQAQGPDGYEAGLTWSAGLRDLPTPKRRKLARRWFRWTAVDEHREVRDQQQIDAILAKVHEHGLHSLTWFEKRALRRATARQRQRDRLDRVSR
ncbi:MAG: hypothetical protein HKL95_01165 [Phycisphaerae bacterium]|nr:hypothetical protein [Phycisphaerae bacterium]